MMTIHTDNGKEGRGKGVTIVHISAGNMDADTIGEACESLSDVDMHVGVVTANSEALDEDEESFADVLASTRRADLVLLNIHSDPSYFKKLDRLQSVIDRGGIPMFLCCSAPEVNKEYRGKFLFPDDDYDLVMRYMKLGGVENSAGVLKWACVRLGGAGALDIPEPVVLPAQGIYRPGQAVVDEDEYLGRIGRRPAVGILFHQKGWIDRDLDPVDALVESIERLGADAIPVFYIVTPGEMTGSIGVRGVIERYFTRGGRPIVGSVVVCMGFSQISLGDPGEGEEEREAYNFFNDLDVAVLQGETIVKSRDRWEEDTVGMGPIEISTSVIWPELDGQVITVPLQFKEKDERGLYRNRFVQDRVDRIASLAVRWAELKAVPPPEAKVVVMLNMYPPCNDRLGGAGGLDTFESIRNMMVRMKEKGYVIDHIPETSQGIVDEMMAALTNDLEWVPADEIPGRAADMIGLERYMEWFNRVPAAPREAMCRNWGDPPGEITTHDGRFIVPGVRNGNLFIGIQPNRGHHAHAEQLYHSTEVVMPHQYLAYYRWIRDEFGADLIVHMGTHGTLEWLPGKGNGLSEDCYPDVVLETMPNVYPYIIDDPGEGMEAKRRTNSVLIGYMVAAMTRADGYEGLAELDVALQALLNTESTAQAEKSEIALDKIHQIITGLSMFKELGLEEGASVEEVAEKAELIYDYVTELKDATIKDGLHVLGHAPEGERMKEMVYCMTRLRNGGVPSLRGSIASARGLDIDALLEDPSGTGADGRLNGVVLDEVDSLAWELIGGMHDRGFSKEECLPFASGLIGPGWEAARATLEFVCDTLHPSIARISDEMDLLLRGSSGGYVPPGPSGSPTRGNAHLLPTGKNYYSIDPETVPNEICWKIGVKMAEEMVDRHVREMGCYPENVGVVVWATDTMKTGGDDIAYILYLMGLRPKWGSFGGRVVGLEVIPVEELGRPRIDVTLRISGMFRDSFPNLVQLIDEGVEIISSLDESDESNYLRKHLRKDIQRYISEGLSPAEASLRSMIRIFGDPPGEHGCGTGVLIESSKWNTIEDLAQAYTTWGCYAYGRKWKGEKMEEPFKNRMSSLDVTVKNHNDREFDLLDIDDDYEVLGGLNAVVRAYGGRKPFCVMGDSSDPDRLKLRTLEEETAFVMRSRVLNPKWVEGLKQHGFRGAMELSKLVEYMLGWDATSDNIEPWMYQSVTERFVLDEENRQWIEENNPYALKEMIEDLLEVIERELWDAPEDIRDRLRDLYLESEANMEELGSAKK
ncbi:MAG: cobaltochelatase subunit CobN [Methanomassiliicoccaceae archaeon]|nr:cobaltochelatase subunit CobN [Methanomassiliicoccaceae archaeon]